jgi:hypothetical protein
MAKKYFKTFFMLTEETSGFGGGDKKPSGRCMIEAFGAEAKVTVYAQDLVPEMKCRLVLSTDGGSVYAGDLYTAPNGKIDARITVSADDIFDSGIAAEHVKSAAVITETRGGLLAPLSSGKWRVPSVPSPKLDRDELDALKEIFVEPEEEAAAVEVTETFEAETFEQVEAVYEPEPEEIVFVELDDGGTEETVAEETAPEKDNVELSGKLETMVRRLNDEMEELSHYAFMEDTACDDMPSLDAFFERDGVRVFPFADEPLEVIWAKVTPEELKCLLLNRNAEAALAECDFVLTGFEQFGHLILGKTGTVDIKYVLGVPSLFNRDDAEITKNGFTHFKCCRGEVKEGAHGYWLKGI